MSKESVTVLGDCQIIRGCPFPTAPIFTAKNIEDAMDYVPKDDDIIIASYPKTGTTWMQYIVLQIASKGEFFPAFDDTTYKVVPYMEASGIAAVEALESKPRVYKHHIPYNLVQKNDKAKYIYVYRHPEDTMVSYYHFANGLLSDASDQLDIGEFYDGFLTGNIAYGSYFRHVSSFYEHRGDDNLLLVSYEKLHADRKGEILRIAKFIGEEYQECLLENDAILNDVIEHTSFDYMKKNLYLTHPSSKSGDQDNNSADRKTVNFFRKGIVGDGKALLADDQRAKLKEAAQRILKGTSVIDEWYSK